MPHLVDAISRTDDVTVAINHLIVERGVAGLSMRAIAGELRLGASTLYAHYGSREHMLRVAAHVTGKARLEFIRDRMHRDGARALLPEDDEDVLTARAWLGWCELGRTHDWLAPTVEEIRAFERAELARRYDYRLARAALDTIVALVDGLLVAICRPERPMPPGAARELLDRQVAGMLAE